MKSLFVRKAVASLVSLLIAPTGEAALLGSQHYVGVLFAYGTPQWRTWNTCRLSFRDELLEYGNTLVRDVACRRQQALQQHNSGIISEDGTTGDESSTPAEELKEQRFERLKKAGESYKPSRFEQEYLAWTLTDPSNDDAAGQIQEHRVACTGEPSDDPSRTVGAMGDAEYSEWMTQIEQWRSSRHSENPK
jgi:hypothetical protein